ncbi:MAG: hypothetical protein JWM85_2094 [Acidimicrobiaceae bacterium]|nr:hypothetical protein [Acidimicrobiaceae bacterium]
MAARLPAPLVFAGLDELGDRPHVMVDGAPRPGTVLTLSHWPATPTAGELARDTSTEIALAYLQQPECWAAGVPAVTCDHLDEDGAAGLFCLVSPEAALVRGRGLAALAWAGDFEVIREPAGARAAWALRYLFDPAKSPFAAGVEDGLLAGSKWAAIAFRGALAVLPELLDSPERFSGWWEEEEEAYRRGTEALERGELRIEVDAELDLALVTVWDQLAGSRFGRVGHGGVLPVHPAVINTATEASRVLVRQGASYCYYDRYESWVRYQSRKIPLRRDLGPLAARLTQDEPEGARWEADAPGALVPVLRVAGDRVSHLETDRVMDTIRRHLAEAPPAWAPKRAGGAYLPVGDAAGLAPEEGGESRAENSEQDASPPTPGGTALSEGEAPRGGTTGRGRIRWRGLRRAAPSS